MKAGSKASLRRVRSAGWRRAKAAAGYCANTVDIAALNAEIERIAVQQSELRVQIDAIVEDLEGVEA
jgi:hypothetical protein